MLKDPIYVFYFIIMHAFKFRFKYYVGWVLAEISLNSSGLSYDALSKDYSRHSNVNIWEIEMSCDFRHKVKVFIKFIQRIGIWALKNGFIRLYTSDQLLIQEKIMQPLVNTNFLKILVTFILSAFWHGFYPCYYISFAYLHFLAMINKIVYNNQNLILGKKGTFLRIFKENFYK